MSYVALYRKYRPVRFDEVIGQEHITRTLTAQVTGGRISHAYLFTGSRGTGKTTCAKIFARAVNCENPLSGSPCGVCKTCVALSDPANIDVLEIDAASNNKVDEVREIRERVKYPPVHGRYKVYIIDEVHMLTDSAFNALLKTLEEPPAHAVFILATTEAHKLPATILSRVMRFDFRLVGVDVLAAHLRTIYDREGKKAEDVAVRYLAAAGEGSVRDMLSIADLCLCAGEGELTLAAAQDILGATDRGKTARLLKSINAGDVPAALELIGELAFYGKSMTLAAKELVSYARDLLVIKCGADKLVNETEETKAEMTAQAENYTADFLTACIGTFSAIDSELRYGVSPKIVLETAVIKACKMLGDDLSSLYERVKRLETQGVPAAVAEKPDYEQNSPLKTEVDDARAMWGRMVRYFRRSENMQLYSLLGGHNDYAVENGTLIVYAEGAKLLEFSDEQTQSAMQRALKSDGLGLKIKVQKRTGGADMDEELAKLKKLMGDVPVNVKR